MSDAGNASASRHDGYESPLGGRYASKEMQRIWSARHKFELWRTIWVAVAKAQKACGVAITDAQITELEDHLEVTDADIARAREHEGRLRHDVMSHVHALGDVCPKARPIIHLGMTSEDINGNAELIQEWQARRLVHRKTDALLVALGDVARRWRSTPALGLTHFQPAQPTTLGRRFANWAYDLRHVQLQLRAGDTHDPTLRGFRGATGTQASFLALFEGDADRVCLFEARAVWNLLQDVGQERGSFEDMVAEDVELRVKLPQTLARLRTKMKGVKIDRARIEAEVRTLGNGVSETSILNAARGFVAFYTFDLTGQTYPRAHDALDLGVVGAMASVVHKIATDIRLLSNKREVEEPFEADQIGSSAMPYKRNPMRCERICGLARFVMNLVPNALDTAATQWLERTLDDSANRRLTLPEAFLALDGCLDLMRNVISGLVVNEAMVRKNLMAEMPFLATEHLMMQAVGLGRDRQDVHEAIRTHSMAAVTRMKTEGAENDLLDRLKTEPLLKGVDFTQALDPMAHIGLAVEQTERFVRDHIDPLRADADEDEPVGPSV